MWCLCKYKENQEARLYPWPPGGQQKRDAMRGTHQTAQTTAIEPQLGKPHSGKGLYLKTYLSLKAFRRYCSAACSEPARSPRSPVSKKKGLNSSKATNKLCAL